MQKKILTLLLGVFTMMAFAQLKVPKENLSITLKKAKRVSKIWGNANISVGKENLLLYAHIEFDSTDPDKKRKIDLNRFSMVDHQTKKRYRADDIAYGHPIGWKEGVMYTTNKKAVAKNSAFYRPELKDTFNDYNLVGYKNIEYKKYFTWPRKEAALAYLSPIDRTIKRIQLFFAFPKKLRGRELDIYYGTEKVGTFKI